MRVAQQRDKLHNPPRRVREKLGIIPETNIDFEEDIAFLLTGGVSDVPVFLLFYLPFFLFKP